MSNPNPQFPPQDSPDSPLNSTGIPIAPCFSCGGAANKRRSPDSSVPSAQNLKKLFRQPHLDASPIFSHFTLPDLPKTPVDASLPVLRRCFSDLCLPPSSNAGTRSPVTQSPPQSKGTASLPRLTRCLSDSSEYNKSFSRNSSSRDVSVDGNFESQWRRKMRGCVEEMNQCFDELMAEKKEEQSYQDKSMAEREPGLVTNAEETVNVEKIASLLPHQPIQRCLSDMGFSRTSSSKDLLAGGSSDSQISKQEEYNKSFSGNFSSRDMLVDGSSESQLLLMNNDQWRKRMRDCVEEINRCSDELMAEKKEEQSYEDKSMAEREVILVTNARERVSVERAESCYILHFKCPCGNCFDILLCGTDCYYKLL